MSNSSLVTYTRITNHKSKRTARIDTVTIHCYVGQVTAKQGVDYFATTDRSASSNYVIGKDGSIGLSVPEDYRSWCSYNSANDNRAITIEMACDTTAPYAVTDKAYSALIDLLVDICKRNKIAALKWSSKKDDRVNHRDGCNMTAHRDFMATACPGEYLFKREAEIAVAVNKKLGIKTETKTEDKKTVNITLDVLKRGDKGEQVKTMQRILKSRGWKDNDGDALVIDGSFGPATEQSLRKFQKKMLGSADGICGAKTWAKLLKG